MMPHNFLAESLGLDDLEVLGLDPRGVPGFEGDRGSAPLAVRGLTHRITMNYENIHTTEDWLRTGLSCQLRCAGGGS